MVALLLFRGIPLCFLLLPLSLFNIEDVMLLSDCICNIGLCKYNTLDFRLNYTVPPPQLRWASVAGCRRLPRDPWAPVWPQHSDLWPQRVVLCQSACLLPALQQISLGPLTQIQSPLEQWVFPHFLLICILFSQPEHALLKLVIYLKGSWRKTIWKKLSQGEVVMKTIRSLDLKSRKKLKSM